MASAPLHVIVGAGQIGPMVAERLAAKGMRVRMIRRGQTQGPIDVVSANVSNPKAAAEAMEGASVVYNCANPRYHRWPEELLPLTRGIAQGATAVGARLVALDNLYMYGVPADGRLSPSTPIAPRSRKGRLRAQAAEEMLGAKTPVAIARASDFFGPNVTNSILGERFWKKLAARKAVEVMGDPDQPHTLSYGPDVADGLVTLGLADESAFGRVWHLPALPAKPIRFWVERFAKEVGREPKMMKLSPFLLHIAGVFIPEAGELPEMMYQWNAPFILDDSDFRERFGASPTPLDRTIADTLTWAKQHYDLNTRAGA